MSRLVHHHIPPAQNALRNHGSGAVSVLNCTEKVRYPKKKSENVGLSNRLKTHSKPFQTHFLVPHPKNIFVFSEKNEVGNFAVV